MKKIVRLTESDLVRLVKRVISEQPTQQTKVSQDSLNKFKNEILVFQKELNTFVNVINEMIKESKYLAPTEVSTKRPEGMWYPSSSDWESKDLNSFLIKYLTDITEIKTFLDDLLKNSFDITKQKYLDESLKLIKGKRFISEQPEHPFKKYLPMVDKFIKSCDRFYNFYDKNFWNTDFGGRTAISQGIYDLHKGIFQFRTYSGAEELSEILQKLK